MHRPVRKEQRRFATLICIAAGLSVGVISGCSPSTVQPLGSSTGPVAPSATAQTKSSWSSLLSAVDKGLQSRKYQEKITVNINEGSIQGGFTVYGRINPPNKVSVAFHQTGANTAFYQQGLSAYGEQSGHWEQSAAMPDLNLFPSYQRLVQSVQAEHVQVFKLATPQYVLDEYCDVYQAEIPAKLIGTLSELANMYRPQDMSPVLYTFYVGQSSGELRQVVTSSEGGVSGIGSIGIQTQTLIFAINQSGSEITIDPNLYNSLLYQY